MNDLNYMWPSCALPLPERFSTGNIDERDAIRLELEQRFSAFFGYPSMIVPSGRAALSLAFQLAGINRGHTVFSPKFSSHCVWNVVGRYGNPTTSITDDVDFILAVHQLGRLQVSSSNESVSPVIEDSCDTLVLNRDALFPNNGIFEIFSLPKIMGSYGGGVLIFKDNDHLRYARDLIASSTEKLSATQGKMRWSNASGQDVNHDAWDASEYKNFVPDFTLANHLLANFDALATNAEVIKSRLAYIDNRCSHLFPNSSVASMKNRLPCVLATKEFSCDTKLMLRHVNDTSFFDKPNFTKMALIPLHFGVEEKRFLELLNGLIDARR